MNSRIVIYLLKEVTNLRVLRCYINYSLLNCCRQQPKSQGANQSLNRFPIKAVADRECKIGPSSAYALIMFGHSARQHIVVTDHWSVYIGQCSLSTCRDKARITSFLCILYMCIGLLVSVKVINFMHVCLCRPTGQSAKQARSGF